MGWAYWLFRLFSRYLSNAVVSAKSPHYFSYPCSSEAVGIAHKPPRSLWCENSRGQTDTQTHRTTTVTLAAHARRGLIMIANTLYLYIYGYDYYFNFHLNSNSISRSSITSGIVFRSRQDSLSFLISIAAKSVPSSVVCGAASILITPHGFGVTRVSLNVSLGRFVGVSPILNNADELVPTGKYREVLKERYKDKKGCGYGYVLCSIGNPEGH